MIVHRSPTDNDPRMLCDAKGCARVEPVYSRHNDYMTSSNPRLKTWRSVGPVIGSNITGLHFCEQHAAVMLDVLLERVAIASHAAPSLREVSTVKPVET